jgi:hypothetical protein
MSDILDLDALLAERSLEPRPVKLGGHTFKVRTDLSGAEVIRYFALARASQDKEALALLVATEDVDALRTALMGVPDKLFVFAMQQIMLAAGLPLDNPTPAETPVDAEENPEPDGESAGESSAS